MIKRYQQLIQLSALIFITLLSTTVASAATLTSTVDKNKLSSSETLTLTLTYDESIDSSSLDLQPLSKNFEVLGVTPQNSSYVSIVNGKATQQASTVWTVTLAPKRDGSLEIPSFTIDGNSSQPVMIVVNDSGTDDKPIEVRVSANSDAIFPFQQLIVEIEIIAQANIGNLNGPELIVADAEVEPLSQQSSQRVDNGVMRQIVVLKYAVFPSKAGEMVIPVMTYSAIQSSPGGISSRIRNRGQRVIARSEQLKIKVKELPPIGSDTWFPANNVTIDAQWSADRSKLTVGEPITRTVTIRAQGQRASLIPPLQPAVTPEGVKFYRDKAQLDNQVTDEGIVATRVESEAIVPSASGKLTLPELKVRWWDVEKEKWQEAVLASETLTVAANPAGALKNDSAFTGQLLDGETTPTDSQQSNWIWQLFSLIFALICAVQFWIILKLRRLPSTNINHNVTNTDEAESWKAVKKSLAGGDPSTIRQCLLSWASTALAGSPRVSLHQLLNRSDNEVVKTELRKLDEQLYKGGDQFNATNLASEISTLRSAILESSGDTGLTDSALPALYKLQH